MLSWCYDFLTAMKRYESFLFLWLLIIGILIMLVYLSTTSRQTFVSAETCEKLWSMSLSLSPRISDVVVVVDGQKPETSGGAVRRTHKGELLPLSPWKQQLLSAAARSLFLQVTRSESRRKHLGDNPTANPTALATCGCFVVTGLDYVCITGRPMTTQISSDLLPQFPSSWWANGLWGNLGRWQKKGALLHRT